MLVSFSFLVPPCGGDPCDDSVPSTSEQSAGSRIAGARLLMQPFVAGLFVMLCKPHNPKAVLAARSAAAKLLKY